MKTTEIIKAILNEMDFCGVVGFNADAVVHTCRTDSSFQNESMEWFCFEEEIDMPAVYLENEYEINGEVYYRNFSILITLESEIYEQLDYLEDAGFDFDNSCKILQVVSDVTRKTCNIKKGDDIIKTIVPSTPEEVIEKYNAVFKQYA